LELTVQFLRVRIASRLRGAGTVAYQRRSDAILEKQLALNVSFGSERQKLLFVNSTAERTDRTISLHLSRAPSNPDAAALAVNCWRESVSASAAKPRCFSRCFVENLL
jgi:hypothetical protein